MRRYTDQNFERIMTDLLSQVPDTLDKREGSIIYDALAPAAIELEKAYIELDNVHESGFVDTATEEDLELRTKEQGVERKPALKTIRHINAQGTGGRIFQGDRFLIDDIYFKVIQTTGIPGIVPVESEEEGSKTVPDYNGTVLSLDGIQGLVSAILVFNHPEDFNGVDAESDEDLRERYYITVRRSPGSGNVDDYIFWCSEVPGVGKVIVQPLWDGPGTVKVTVLDSNGDPASPGLITDVKSYLDPVDGEGMGKAPIGAHVTVEAATPKTINVIANVEKSSSRTMDEIKQSFETELNNYYKQINLSSAREVIYNKVGAILLSINSVMDYNGLTINGETSNITLVVNEIPTLGVVVLNEI